MAEDLSEFTLCGLGLPLFGREPQGDWPCLGLQPILHSRRDRQGGQIVKPCRAWNVCLFLLTSFDSMVFGPNPTAATADSILIHSPHLKMHATSSSGGLMPMMLFLADASVTAIRGAFIGKTWPTFNSKGQKGSRAASGDSAENMVEHDGG